MRYMLLPPDVVRELHGEVVRFQAGRRPTGHVAVLEVHVPDVQGQVLHPGR